VEDALYEIESMRRFAGLELNEDAIPDETTILKFRRFLEQHKNDERLAVQFDLFRCSLDVDVIETEVISRNQV
jgi:IS5 family transposase